MNKKEMWEQEIKGRTIGSYFFESMAAGRTESKKIERF